MRCEVVVVNSGLLILFFSLNGCMTWFSLRLMAVRLDFEDGYSEMMAYVQATK